MLHYLCILKNQMKKESKLPYLTKLIKNLRQKLALGGGGTGVGMHHR